VQRYKFLLNCLAFRAFFRTFASKMTYEEFWRPLMAVYDIREAQAVARLVLEERYSLTLADVLCGRMGDERELLQIQARLLLGEPVQYVLGETVFGGRRFHVAPGVLIPRPETFELCQWVMTADALKPASEAATEQSAAKILDIGTGSGCIACTLAAELPHTQVTAWDISDDALRIAKSNAEALGVNVKFEQVDVLSTLHPILWNVIVSNPPYICERERTSMEGRVVDYEPEGALFVPDDDPLLFYRAIARYARQTLTPGGGLFFEINPLYVNELEQLLTDGGFASVESRNDQFGKIRFTKAIQP
jgi:release factor glutamine methyltransferase